VLVRSPAAKERLLSYVSSGNHEKVRTAPITEIVAYDREFFELSPRLYPHTDDPHRRFTTNSALAEETGRRNSSRGALILSCHCAPKVATADRCRGSTPTRSTRRSSPIADIARTFC